MVRHAVSDGTFPCMGQDQGEWAGPEMLREPARTCVNQGAVGNDLVQIRDQASNLLFRGTLLCREQAIDGVRQVFQAGHAVHGVGGEYNQSSFTEFLHRLGDRRIRSGKEGCHRIQRSRGFPESTNIQRLQTKEYIKCTLHDRIVCRTLLYPFTNAIFVSSLAVVKAGFRGNRSRLHVRDR